jgi:hypothetical protein
MEEAEQGLPPHPLAGLTLVAEAQPQAASAPVETAPAAPEPAPAAPANDDKPQTFEGILDKLFGGT